MLSRRSFLLTSAASAAAPVAWSRSARAADAKPSDRITLGFIGVGKIGRSHLNNFVANKGVEVVAVSDVEKERLDSAREIVEKKYADRSKAGTYQGCKVYPDFRDLLARPGLDAVVIATPDHWHAIPCVLAARANKHIYCEKPLSHLAAEGRWVADEVKKAGVVFQTGSQQRSEYDGRFRSAVEMIWDGRIGPVKTVRIGIGGPPKPCDLPTQETPAGTDWDFWLGPAQERGYNEVLCPKGVHNHFPNWRHYEEFGGGAVCDFGAHMFDIAQWALKMDTSGPVKVIPPDDATKTKGLRFVYANGVEMIHDEFGTDDRTGKPIKASCVFEGPDGTILVGRNQLEVLAKDGTRAAEPPKTVAAGNHRQNWLDCIKSGKETTCTAETGHRTATVCHLANIGYKLRRPLGWDPVKEVFVGDESANKELTREPRTGSFCSVQPLLGGLPVPSRRDILLWSAASALPWGATLTAADAPADLTRVLPPGEKPTDPRLGPPKTTREGYFPFVPSKTVEEWTKRRKELREQVLVANGLWPMPEKTPLNPVIHGSIDRNGYTVEKVFFASTPGHYVTGNLYRPKPNGAKPTDSLPAILCSYGHFPDGRLGQTTDATVTKSLASGGEGTKESARYPLQARSAALAKLGFVVFHYDMVGYADSTAIPHVLRGGVPHPNGFGDVEGELRLQSLMGLQTWNTVRALDFLESLPGVDPKRLGITGESGGATQVILLGAIDDRLAAAFPAVMVGTAMQGGCVCENCTYLRVGTGNVELSGLFAPKPLAMSGANDWTKEIMTKGYPELKQLYKLLGAEENVAAKAWVQFPHGFNQVAREFMESWFSKHLLGKAEDVKEPPLVPVPPKELAVFDADHPRPADELDAPKLRAKLTKASDEQMAKLPPAEFRRVVGTALRVMVGELPVAAVVRKGPEEVKLTGGVRVHKAVIGRDGGDDTIPTLGVLGEKFTGNVVVWVDPAGKASLFEKGELVPAARRLTDAGYGILAPDLLGTGELTPEKPFAVNPAYAGYTFAYNRPLLANRVRDVLTAIAFARSALKAKAIHLTGWGAFGPVAVLAKAAAGDAVGKTAADLNKFRFENIKDVNDEMLLPGAVKYGGLPAFLALCAPGPILAYNPADGSDGKVPTTAYDAAGAKRQFALEPARLSAGRVVDWLTA